MRGMLNQEWANWRKFYKFQPTDAIMKYFGVKIGFYFAWLGFYTAMLVIPSIMGILSFFYGLVRMYTDIPTEDICDGFQGSRIMCPACRGGAAYLYLISILIWPHFDTYQVRRGQLLQLNQ